MFRFSPIYVPGKKNVVPDCWSRRNDSPIATTPAPVTTPIQTCDISNILPGYQDHLGPPSWVASPNASSTASLSAMLSESTGEDDNQTDMSSLLATVSAAGYSYNIGSSDADDLLRGQGMSSLANLSEDECGKLCNTMLSIRKSTAQMSSHGTDWCQQLRTPPHTRHSSHS